MSCVASCVASCVVSTQVMHVLPSFCVCTTIPTYPPPQHQNRALLRAQGVSDAERAQQQDAVNPVYIPRNHVMQQAITAAEIGDFGPVNTLLQLYTNPFQRVEDDGGLQAEEPAPRQCRMGVELLSCSS